MRGSPHLTALAVGGGLLLAACGGDPGSQQNRIELQRFTAPDFAVDVPGHPHQSKQTVPSPTGDVEVTAYSVFYEDSAISFLSIPIPDGLGLRLEDVVASEATNLSGTVEDGEALQYAGHEARDARITAHNGSASATVFVRLIAVDGAVLEFVDIVEVDDLAEPPEVWDDVLASVDLE